MFQFIKKMLLSFIISSSDVIEFENYILSGIVSVNKEEMRVVISFEANNSFEALQWEDNLMKQQLFWSCFW